jgi:hypothetical protein
MASSPGPSTLEDTPRRITTANRSFTVPAKVSTPTKSPSANPEIGSTEGIETLYHHPNAKLVKFTASARPGASIPWESPTESTIAVGELEIYRVPGSVSFLHSGPIIHTIMKRSNCWCVDGVSKFVLRILMDKYYRIELPGETEEDLEHVEKFKVTLEKVCYYERTPCPFARTFSVDLPDEPEVVRKGKRRKSTGPAKKWKLDRVWRPEGWVEPEKVSEESASGSGSPDGSDEDSDAASTPMEAEETADEVRDITPTTPMRQRALAALRSASAPQSPAPLSTPPSRLRTKLDVDGTIEVTEPVASGSSDPEAPRLRMFQAIPTDMPPSPPDSSAGLEYNDDRGRGENNAVDEQLQASSAAGSDDTAKPAPGKTVTIDGQIQYYEDISGDQTIDSNQAVEEHTPFGEEVTPNEASAAEGASETRSGAEEVVASVDKVAPETSNESMMSRAADLDPELPPQQKAVDDVTETSPAAEDSEETLSEDHEFPGPQTPQILQEIVQDEESEAPPAEEALTGAAPPDEALPEEELRREELPEEDDDNRPRTPENQTSGDDPYAAIQARIMARRSLSGTVSFHPSYKSPTRQSTSSNSSTATISSSRSALSKRSQPSQQQQAFASAMVKKAYNAFLGPPAHLVAIMLKIAARFANGAFGVESMFYVESSIDSPRKVPGTYYVTGDDVEELDSDFEEDDFGVPLNSPVRLASRSDSGDSARERRRWDVD